MLSLCINGGKEDKDELLIDYQSSGVGFTVLSKEAGQIDFSIEKEEWNQLKTFIEQAISWEGKNKTSTEE